MKNLICRLLAFGCWAACIVAPLLALYLLWDLPLLMKLIREGGSQSAKIHWETVVHWQEVTVWAIAAVNLAITLLALYFLRPVLLQFAEGEFFNLANSVNLRRFSWVMVFQGLLRPMGLTTLVLSWNHPPGQRMLSLGFSGGAIGFLGLGFLLLMISDLLVRGAELERENAQFV